MPRVNLPVTAVTRAGVVSAGGGEVTGDSSNNHSFKNDGRTFLHIRNSAATATRTVTLVIAKTVDGQPVTNPTVSVPVTSEKLVGPFPAEVYNQQSGADEGFCYINVDHADLKLEAFRVG